MCKVLYMAAEVEMPRVEGDIKGSGFLVRQVSNIPPGLERHFTKRHVVYVGVKGCACGFFWEDDYPQAAATRENDVEAFECTRELIEYIAEVLKACDLVEATIMDLSKHLLR